MWGGLVVMTFLPCLTVCTLAQNTFQSSSEEWLHRSHPRRSKLAVTTNLSKSLRHLRISSRSPPRAGGISLGSARSAFTPRRRNVGTDENEGRFFFFFDRLFWFSSEKIKPRAMNSMNSGKKLDTSMERL